MLPECERAGLTIIDVQQRLVPAMHDVAPVLANLQRLIRGMQCLDRPVWVTEQYPRGLGPTVSELLELLPGPHPDKVAFSCYGCAAWAEAVAPYDDLILGGIEAHVCVLQTALDAVARGRRVFVAADAVTSRRADHRDLALAALRAAGVMVLPTESLLFALVGQAGTDRFRQIAQLVR